MRRSIPRAGLIALCLALAPALAHAQVFTPSFQAPNGSGRMGVYLSEFGDLAIEGALRKDFSGTELGARVGFVDMGASVTDLSLGGELRHPLHLDTDPVDLAAVAGAQLLIGDVDAFGFSGGVSLGHTFRDPSLNITPYFVPRIGLVDCGDACSLDAQLLADLGVDLQFPAGFRIQLNVGLDNNHSDWGIGFAWK